MSSKVFLFAPGSDMKKAEKALGSQADSVILDLEDAVAPSEKVQARTNVAQLLERQRSKQVLVRINALTTVWSLQDMLAILPQSPDGILLPKTESTADVQALSWVMDQVGGQGETKIYPLIETAAGVENAKEIVQASQRIGQLFFGALDYYLDLGLSYTEDPECALYARSRLVAASVSGKLPGPIDTVYPVIKDEDGLRRDCVNAKKLGFRGKMIIHPAQIPVVQEVFASSKEELQDAKQIVDIYEKAQLEGKGAIQWKGKMLDEPVLRRAKQIVAEFED